MNNHGHSNKVQSRSKLDNTGKQDDEQGTRALKKGQSRETSNTGYTGIKMDNPEKLATQGTPAIKKDNPEKLETQGTQDDRTTRALKKGATQGTPTIINGQSRENSNTGYTGYQKWTIQRN